MNASQVKSLTDQYRADIDETNKAACKVLLEDYEQSILKVARLGRYSIVFQRRTYDDIICDNVIKMLREKGYSVVMNDGNNFTVDWS